MDEFKPPLSRVEAILQNLLGANNVLTAAESRVEAILLSFIDDSPYEEAPQSRVEELLLAIKSGGSYDRTLLSKVEEILKTKLEGETWPEESNERVEELLIEWTNELLIESDPDTDPYISRDFPLDSLAANVKWQKAQDKIVGGTVAWNQLIAVPDTDESTTKNGITFTDNRDGTFSVTTDSNGSTADTPFIIGTIKFTNGHKYYFKGTPSGGRDNTWFSYLLNNSVFVTSYDYGKGRIYSATADGTVSIVAARIRSGVVIEEPRIFKPMCVDLTRLFTPSIADHIYSLENTTAGKGVERLHEWGFFTEDFYAYSDFRLESVKGLTAHLYSGNNKAHSYPLDSSLTLNGIFKLNASTSKIRAEGDSYGPDGRVSRKAVRRILNGSEDWVLVGSYVALPVGAKNSAVRGDQRIICDKYTQATISSSTSGVGIDLLSSGTYNDDRITFRNGNTYANIDGFKAWLADNPIEVCYLMKETISTEEAEPFDERQTTEMNGTEEYVSTSLIPIGHDTVYFGSEVS